jgi:hypothetical protein
MFGLGPVGVLLIVATLVVLGLALNVVLRMVSGGAANGVPAAPVLTGAARPSRHTAVGPPATAQ